MELSTSPKKLTWKRDWKMNKWLYILAIPVFLYFFIFHYLPMFGIVIAFEDFKPQLGVFGSKWVGFKKLLDDPAQHAGHQRHGAGGGLPADDHLRPDAE